MKNKKLKIIPLGGLGEVGKNMTVYEYDHQILIVDAGMMFPDSDMIGIDYIIPDFEYVKQRADQVVGIVITHGHEDHIGALAWLVPYLQDVPLYGSEFTLRLAIGQTATRRVHVEEAWEELRAHVPRR